MLHLCYATTTFFVMSKVCTKKPKSWIICWRQISLLAPEKIDYFLVRKRLETCNNVTNNTPLLPLLSILRGSGKLLTLWINGAILSYAYTYQSYIHTKRTLAQFYAKILRPNERFHFSRKTWIYLTLYVFTERIFDSQLIIYNKIFLKNLLHLESENWSHFFGFM